MRGSLSAGALALAMAVTVAVPSDSSAQEWGSWKFDLGVNGGYAWWSDMLDEDEAFDDQVVNEVQFEPGWITGATATFWLRDRLGLRANFAYTDRALEANNFFDNDGDLGDDGEDQTVIDDVNLWHGTGDLMFRFTKAEDRRFVPYFALGAGATWINPAGDNVFAETEDGEDGTVDLDADREGFGFTVATGQTYILEEETKFTGLVALGSDIRLGRNFGLRLEVGDRIFEGALKQANRIDGGEFVRLTDDEDDASNLVHEVYGTLGLHLLLGVEEEEVVAVAPAPPPPPPAPEPEPVEEAITVCVIDPADPMGLRTVNAVFLPASGDTLVVVNGTRTPLSQATPDVVIASEADWFVRGQPMSFSVGNQRFEFVNFGTTRVINAGDLELVGLFRGVPVYADRDEIADIRDELAEARAEGDLEEALEERGELNEEISELSFLYVPVAGTGCVFQPLQRAQEVRKVRG